MFLETVTNPLSIAAFLPDVGFLKGGHLCGVRKELGLYLDYDEAVRYRGWANRYFT